MIKIENVILPSGEQLEAVIRGMRNPKNSWDKSDSNWELAELNNSVFVVGENDLGLMNKLVKAGPAHAKYKRMIWVYCDVVAPMYWWKEWDTYTNTVRNSCSTMHKLMAKEFEPIDFSTDHLSHEAMACLNTTLAFLNEYREEYLLLADEIKRKTHTIKERQALTNYMKDLEYQIIQLLPSSYNQRATIMMNYETLTAIYRWRKNHKLDEWKDFCKWIKSLPMSEIILGGV